MVKEIITIAVGQAGVQVADAAWELICMEHGIHTDGTPYDEEMALKDQSYLTFFKHAQSESKNKASRYIPRAIMCDLEPSVVDEIRCGAYKQLFHPENLLTGLEDAANNWARGHFSQGKTLINIVMESVRKQAADCENLEGFLVLCGFGGGTGSGLTDMITERLTQEFAKRTKVQSCIFPGGVYSTAVVEPYNCILSSNSSIDHIDVAFQFDNEALYSVCNTQLHVPRPTYIDINRVLAQVLSTITCSIRFDNYLNADLTQVQTNLVPFPRIHFPVASFAPFYAGGVSPYENSTVNEITLLSLQKECQLASCNLLEGKFMAVLLQYRGHCSPQSVNKAITMLKNKTMGDTNELKFVDWSPTGFKVGICSQPSITLPNSSMSATNKSVCCVANNTNVGLMWQRLWKKFDTLFSKRAFVHWFVGEGMEEGEFLEAKDYITKLCQDYEDCGKLTEKDDENDGYSESEDQNKAPQSSGNTSQSGQSVVSPEAPPNELSPHAQGGSSLNNQDNDASAEHEAAEVVNENEEDEESVSQISYQSGNHENSNAYNSNDFTFSVQPGSRHLVIQHLR